MTSTSWRSRETALGRLSYVITSFSFMIVNVLRCKFPEISKVELTDTTTCRFFACLLWIGNNVNSVDAIRHYFKKITRSVGQEDLLISYVLLVCSNGIINHLVQKLCFHFFGIIIMPLFLRMKKVPVFIDMNISFSNIVIGWIVFLFQKLFCQ